MTNIITNNKLKCTVALAALQMVMDPEIGLNIVDLGLIYQIDFDDEGQKVFCTMTLTTQFCPMGASISSAVRETLNATFPNSAAEVTLTFDPSWSHELISGEGLEFLNEK